MDVAGDDRPNVELLGELPQGRVPPRVATLVGTLELDEEALAAECSGKSRSGIRVAHRDSASGAAGEAHEPVVQLLEETLIESGIRCWLGFLSHRTRVCVRCRDQPAEVRVPLR